MEHDSLHLGYLGLLSLITRMKRDKFSKKIQHLPGILEYMVKFKYTRMIKVPFHFLG